MTGEEAYWAGLGPEDLHDYTPPTEAELAECEELLKRRVPLATSECLRLIRALREARAASAMFDQKLTEAWARIAAPEADKRRLVELAEKHLEKHRPCLCSGCDLARAILAAIDSAGREQG